MLKTGILWANNSPLSSWSTGRRDTPGSHWRCFERYKQTLCHAVCPLCRRIFCRPEVTEVERQAQQGRSQGLKLLILALSSFQQCICLHEEALHIPVYGDLFHKFVGHAVMQDDALWGNLERNFLRLLPTRFSLYRNTKVDQQLVSE